MRISFRPTVALTADQPKARNGHLRRHIPIFARTRFGVQWASGDRSDRSLASSFSSRAPFPQLAAPVLLKTARLETRVESVIFKNASWARCNNVTAGRKASEQVFAEHSSGRA